MRIRQVKPSFWSDPEMAELPERTRLFYIGLWMLADDAGWLRWDAAEAAHELYGYEPRKQREKRVGEMFDDLVIRGRVLRHRCGHAFIPKLREHQRFGSPEKQVRTFEREHTACPQVPAGDSGDPQKPGTELERERERLGTERGGTGGTAPTEGSARPFNGMMPPFEKIIGGKAS